MKKYILLLLALVTAASCKRPVVQPRPAIGLVHAVVADTAGLYRLVAQAGRRGAEGSIAIIGEPENAILLARRFQGADFVDNIDGGAGRDSLQDFAGESFDVVMDAANAPYAHFWQVAEPLADSLRHQVLDSLREAAVQNALFAWDSTCYRQALDPEAFLHKQRAKILIYTSSLNARWGLFDVDTLQQLCGGQSRTLSPVHTLLADAYAAGARNIAVWTSRDIRSSGAWQAVFAEGDYPDARLAVVAPEAALDVRTEFRSFLRQYRSTGRPLDALLLDSYTIDVNPLLSELKLIRIQGTEEDTAFSQMLSPGFQILDPIHSLIGTTYRLLRENHLFTHKIARPAIHFYETDEGEYGNNVIIETTASYALSTYVPDLN